MLRTDQSAGPDTTPAASPKRGCDPITLEIVRGAIRAAQAEMEALIERTAISAFIREKKDFYTALFDADGVMAVGSNVPIFGDLTSPVFARYPIETMKPGDLYWYNDCYGSRGAVSHSNDQVLLAPVFHEGRRCAFVMSWAHFADIGGLRPGSISPDATDIFQEGVIIPPSKLIDAGKTNEEALAIFHRNSRYPDQSRGDMRALIGSVEVGVKRVGEIVARFGADVIEDALALLLERTRRLVRGKLAENFASGTHSFTDAIDGDGHGSGPLHLRLSLTREKDSAGEDRFIFDGTATDDQSVGPVNFLMNPGVPGMALGLYYLGGDPAMVCNAGGPQALDEVRLREGSLLWPKFPAPLGMRGLTMMRLLATLNGLVNAGGGTGARVALRLRHLYHARLLPDAIRREADVPSGRRPGCRIRSAALCGRDRRSLFRRAGELSGRVPGAGLPGAAADLRGRRGQRRSGSLSRRLRHHPRIRDPRRGSRDGDPHRLREEPALGHRRRDVGRRRAGGGQSGYAAKRCSRLCRTATCSGVATSCAS